MKPVLIVLLSLIPSHEVFANGPLDQSVADVISGCSSELGSLTVIEENVVGDFDGIFYSPPSVGTTNSAYCEEADYGFKCLRWIDKDRSLIRILDTENGFVASYGGVEVPCFLERNSKSRGQEGCSGLQGKERWECEGFGRRPGSGK